MYIEKDTKLWGNIRWSHISSSLHELFYYIKEKGNAELYLVGGCVRDLLLGKEPKDYDLCTNLKPEEIKELLKDVPFECDEDTAISYAMEGEHCPDSRYTFIDTGLKHGTITIHDNEYDMFYEITTYRVDGKYTDGRHPDEITFTPSLEEDLKRRDFTINSFAYDLSSDELVMLDSYYKTDLELGIIRTVGDPVDRFNEDALRMLRAIRFAAQLNFSISKNVYNGLCQCAPLMVNISKERIRDELTKILLSDNPQMLEFIVTTSMEQYLFDGTTPITDMLNCEHQNPWHYTDVFHHTMDVVKKLPKDFNLRWAALLHDVGKPVVKKLKPGTSDHYRYIGHPEASAKIADNLMEVLKFSNEQKEIIHNFVLYHDYPLATCSSGKFKQMIVTIGEENFKSFIKLIEADGLAHRLSKSTGFAIDGVSEIKYRYNEFISSKAPLRIRDLAINGDDIKADGFLEGKEIGDCLKWMLRIVLDHPEYNTKEKLLEYLDLYKAMTFQNS